MRRILFWLVALFALAGALFLIHDRLVAFDNPGYAIIGIGRWSIETSLFVVGILFLILFALFYWAVRVLVFTLNIPKILKRRSGEQRNLRSQEALLLGLIESAEGNWEKAEKNLIRHASHSDLPLIHYMTAARAAHSRGAIEKRDEYFRLANEIMPEAELAIGLTKAELQLSNQQFDDALESLIHLNSIVPSHAAVLKMMHKAYAQLDDWESVSRMIPVLHKNKVLLEAEIKLLETEAYSALLKQQAKVKDAASLQALWKKVPQHIRTVPGIVQLYVAAMIEAGSGVEVEPLAREALRKNWSDTLLILYGCIPLVDAQKQLLTAQAWLPARSNDPILLRVLGKIALRADKLEKAKEYIEDSLSIEPSVEAYRMMGDVCLKQDDPLAACDYFRRGLLFASEEVVAQIEQNPEDQPSEEVLLEAENLLGEEESRESA